jgi:integrase
MARRVRDKDIETREARRKLKQSGKPYWRSIGKGLHVGFRKGKTGGVWVVRHYIGNQHYKVETIATADDIEDADGERVLDFWQAQEAARAIRPAVGSGGRSRWSSVKGYTVANAVTDYLEYLETKATHRISRQRFEAFVLPILGDRPVNDLDEDELRRWHRNLAKQPARVRTAHGKPQRYKNNSDDVDAQRKRQLSANIILNLLKAALNRAHKFRKQTGVRSDAWKLVEPFKGVNVARSRYLTIAECKRLLNASETEFRVLVRAALETGARYQELARLRVADFNPDSGTVHVRRSKTGRDRHIFLTDEGQEFFAGLAGGRASTDLLLGREWGETQQAYFIKRACERAKIIPSVSFHMLRHTWASLAVMAGAPLMVVAKNLGHVDTRMVERHYGHLAPSFVADAIRAAAPRFGIVQPSNVRSL